MANLKHGIIGICNCNKDGSYTTQQDRLRILLQAAEQLKILNYRQLTIHSIKGKHINALIDHWNEQHEINQLSIATIKNRMSALRWFLNKVNRSQLIPKENQTLGIARRDYKKTVNDNKSQQLDNRSDLITDKYVQYSLKLQQAFGLRREECIKFNPVYADQDHYIQLKASWTKGGRPRTIPIRNEQQRALIDEIKQLVGNNSLIPAHKSYIQQRNHYDNQVKQAGYNNLHGLRHSYAQQRYREITGSEPPICGGKTSKDYTLQEKLLDQQARLTLSKELGHGREEVTVQYLGR